MKCELCGYQNTAETQICLRCGANLIGCGIVCKGCSKMFYKDVRRFRKLDFLLRSRHSRCHKNC